MVASTHRSLVHEGVVGRWKACGVVSGFVHRPLVYAAAMSNRQSYAELHCHSAFSFLDGASLPEDLVATAHELGYAALALTDHNGLYGSMTFAQAAKPLDLQAITGAEVTLEDGAHLTLLAETPRGYANLCRLLTETHLGADRLDPRLAFDSLAARHEGLVLLSGCRRDGLLPRALESEGLAAARRLAERCKEVFGKDRFFVELQRNPVRGDVTLTRTLKDFPYDLPLAIVAT